MPFTHHTSIFLAATGTSVAHADKHFQRIVNASTARHLRQLSHKANSASIFVILGIKEAFSRRNSAVCIGNY